jgi:hypothetical protein
MEAEEIHNLYASPNIIGMIKSRRTRWARHVARMGGKIKAEGKRPLGRPRHKWEDISMDLKRNRMETMWTGFIWLRIGNSCRAL